jgi:hypothetical protein
LETILTDDEAAELGLPAHVPGTKDPVEWSQAQTELECKVCHNKIPRTLNLPPDVSLGQPKFVCRECTSSNGRRRQAIKRRGRPRKASPLDDGFILDEENGQEYFFHRCDWIDNSEPTRYAKVIFELGKFNGRIKAVKVRRQPQAVEVVRS